jgi:hypothetical protein
MRKKFHAQCKAAGIPGKMVILNIKTRWNSIYEMLTRARELKEVNLINNFSFKYK